mmetsp:Transcript_23817/g.46939  ORF Transcript_23817/g.46939 Transcript_23817/m.46939 type:complete len:217 (+) Transcript_23817:166-816(+)
MEWKFWIAEKREKMTTLMPKVQMLRSRRPRIQTAQMAMLMVLLSRLALLLAALTTKMTRTTKTKKQKQRQWQSRKKTLHPTLVALPQPMKLTPALSAVPPVLTSCCHFLGTLHQQKWQQQEERHCHFHLQSVRFFFLPLRLGPFSLLLGEAGWPALRLKAEDQHSRQLLPLCSPSLGFSECRSLSTPPLPRSSCESCCSGQSMKCSWCRRQVAEWS